MKIVTAADDKYFDFLIEQIRGCQENLNKYPYVFDLGLSERQNYILKAMGIKVFPKPPEPKRAERYPNGYTPRALFKPMALHTFCEMYSGDVVWLDADAMPVQPFEFPCKGLGLTPVDEKKLSMYKGTDLEEYVGPYHSGVIFLGQGKGRMDFLKRWALELWKDKYPSDKKSMNKVIKQEHITDLDTDEWNARVMYPHTKIFHYQGPVAR